VQPRKRKNRGPACGCLFGGIGPGDRRGMLTEHGGPQLRTRRLTERVVLRQGEQRGNLHLRDVVLHARHRRWGVLPMRPHRHRVHRLPYGHNTQLATDPKIEAVHRLYDAYGPRGRRRRPGRHNLVAGSAPRAYAASLSSPTTSTGRRKPPARRFRGTAPWVVSGPEPQSTIEGLRPLLDKEGY
jgi:hypothetical protein